LFAAFTFDAVEDVRPDAVRMDSAKDIAASGNVTLNKSDRLLAAVIIEDLAESAKPCLEVAFTESYDHKSGVIFSTFS
jgi:hypothetical protein